MSDLIYVNLRTFIRNIILFHIIAVYFFGTAGFTIHHCCCHKSYNVTNAVLNIFHPYVEHNCKRIAEHISADKVLKFRQYRHCGEWNYTILGENYNGSQKTLIQSPILDLLAIIQIPVLEIIKSQPTVKKENSEFIKKRRWRQPVSRLILKI